MPFDNRIRPGARTSVTVDPKIVLEDINQEIRRLEPSAVPLQTFASYIGTEAPPKNHKFQTKQYHVFDNYDYCSSVTLGTGNFTRYARLTLDQPSRPTTRSSMLYYPQDKFFIVATGQVVEVVMNERASMPMGDGSNLSISDTTLTGNSTTRSADGTVVVRNTEPTPILPFSQSDVIYLGRTIYEGQPIEAESRQRDFIFDVNFLEHKEAVLEMTEDQVELVKTDGKVPDWNFQQEETIREFKISVDYNLIFSERSVDYTVPDKPKRHTRGLYNSIRTNVSVYNPQAVTDFEAMFGNFMYDQAFRYGNKMTKIGLCGGRFLYDFNQAFKDYRRTSKIESIGKKIGLNFNTYEIPGGFSVTLTRTEALRQNTPLEYWCFIIDTSQMGLKLAKNYETRDYSLPTDRFKKFMIEWQGGIAWHLEQVNALLKTV